MAEHRYAEKWLVLDRKPLNGMTSAAARERHASRLAYVALIGDPERPSHVVELVGPWVKVSFLDQALREYLLYSFKEVKPGRLFLKQAIHREFVDDSNEVSVATIFAFGEKGTMVAERQDMTTNETDARKGKIDPTPNWEQYPEFGAYTDLLREERTAPA